MDPKAAPQLDPKLQEIYDRVMGTSTTDAPTQPAPATPSSPQPTATDTPASPAPSPMPTATGAPIPTPQDAATPAADPAAPVLPTAPEPMPSPLPAAPVEVAPATMPISPTPDTRQDAPKLNMPNVEPEKDTKQHAFVAKKGGLKISPAILMLGGIAFLLIYTVIWIKVFNLSVPFINQ